jgi:hypothetical protein
MKARGKTCLRHRVYCPKRIYAKHKLMDRTDRLTVPLVRGVRLRGMRAPDALAACEEMLSRLGCADLSEHIQAESGSDDRGTFWRLHLSLAKAHDWAPGFDTMGLSAQLGLHPFEQPKDLLREIIIALLLSPVALDFPSLDEFESAVLIRRNCVLAARKTSLAFETEKAERPSQYWTYLEGTGFILKPGVDLVEALVMATQPEISGQQYSFSCYRATEYIILQSIAQELQRANPELLQRLQHLWTQRSIMSAEFHDVFLQELGSIADPLPALYYVPGDRVWFRNPDEASADATGFEGSWVIYLGSGLFNNFWNHTQPYSLAAKCVEIFHWRHGLYRDDQGEARIDEERIKPLIQASLHNPEELARVMALMSRWREPRGVYTEAGGCMDTSREFTRRVRPGSTDMSIPKT